MNFFQTLSSAVINASTAALQGQGASVPGCAGYAIGAKVREPSARSPWALFDGTKKDDSSPVSVLVYDAGAPGARRDFGPLARNSLRKLRTLRHPHILRFLDGSEHGDAQQVYIVTERVRPLWPMLDAKELKDEALVYGLLHVVSALAFLNDEGASTHANIRPEAIFVTQGGDWRLGGFELCSRKDDPAAVLYTHAAAAMPDSKMLASPEVRRDGWASLKDYDAFVLDAFQLHLLIYTLFNGPLPPSFSTATDAAPPTLPPSARGSMPPPLHQASRRLGAPNPGARLSTRAFLDLGTGAQSATGGWWSTNRLVRLAAALDNFALASAEERTALVRLLRDFDRQKGTPRALPEGFLLYKVLPSLVHTSEFGGGGPQLIPLVLSLASNLPEQEHDKAVVQPLVRMFASPDREMRMALLDGLDKFAGQLSAKDINERVWPHLATGFGDVVPVIREATIKAVPLLAPKLSERTLNNDLLRVLAKTQSDPVPGIRTNTCILLGRIAKQLSPSTARKVLVPAFARAVRDPFVHARIAGLMALMATIEIFEREDLAGKVIPSMSICLVDREKSVRMQAYKAMEVFIKRCEKLTADMPDSVLPPEAAPSEQPSSVNQPGLATNAGGAAGALASWAFASVSRKLASGEVGEPVAQPSGTASPVPTVATQQAEGVSLEHAPPVANGSAAQQEQKRGPEDWGGDLMDVNDDTGDWNEFESGQDAPAPKVDPIAARLSSSRAKPVRGGVARRGGAGGSAMRLGAASKSASLRLPMDMDATDSWDFDANGDGEDDGDWGRPMAGPSLTTSPKKKAAPPPKPKAIKPLQFDSIAAVPVTNPKAPPVERFARGVAATSAGAQRTQSPMGAGRGSVPSFPSRSSIPARGTAASPPAQAATSRTPSRVASPSSTAPPPMSETTVEEHTPIEDAFLARPSIDALVSGGGGDGGVGSAEMSAASSPPTTDEGAFVDAVSQAPSESMTRTASAAMAVATASESSGLAHQELPAQATEPVSNGHGFEPAAAAAAAAAAVAMSPLATAAPSEPPVVDNFESARASADFAAAPPPPPPQASAGEVSRFDQPVEDKLAPEPESASAPASAPAVVAPSPPGSPAPSLSSSVTGAAAAPATATASAPLTKEEKAAKIAQAREERRARMAAMRAAKS